MIERFLMKQRDVLDANGSEVLPVGTILPWFPRFFSNPNNTGLHGSDMVSLSPKWRLCDGSAPNIDISPIWNTVDKYVPDLTDDRFICGDVTVGGIGGQNSIIHLHNVTHKHTVNIWSESIDWNHTHNLTLPEFNYKGTSNSWTGSVSPATSRTYTQTVSLSAGLHSHTFGQRTTEHPIGTPLHPNTGIFNSANETIDNRPKYLKVKYIIKVV